MTNAKKPSARRANLRVQADAEVPVVTDELTGEAFYLRPEWLATWERCDGERDVAAIAREVDGDVWASLDALADLGLLDERVAPPAGSSQVTRRSLLRATAVAGAVVAAVAVAAQPAAAAQQTSEEKLKADSAREQDKKAAAEEREKNKSGEQQNKEAKLKSRNA